MLSRDFVPIPQASRPGAAVASRYGLWIDVERGDACDSQRKQPKDQTERRCRNSVNGSDCLSSERKPRRLDVGFSQLAHRDFRA
jgi:hypothetical protein